MEATLTIASLDTKETAHRNAVAEIRFDVRALFNRLSLKQIVELGQQKLACDGFDADRCTSLSEAEAHLLEIYEAANLRRGKIRQVICRARAR